MQQKNGDVDLDELKMDVVKQEPRQRVQMYFDHLNKLFRKGKLRMLNRGVGFLCIYVLKLGNFVWLKIILCERNVGSYQGCKKSTR